MEVNKIVDDYLKLLDKRLDTTVEPWDLSVELEDFTSAEMYDFLRETNPKLLQLIADDIYDITEPMEPAMDGDEFYKNLETFKEKVLNTVK